MEQSRVKIRRIRPLAKALRDYISQNSSPSTLLGRKKVMLRDNQ
ncbi:hypothetical protein [Scytonema sp. NUACC26]